LVLLWLALLGTAVPGTLAAQDEGAPIRWWQGVLAAGGVSALMLLDHPVQRYAQDNRTGGSNDFSMVARHFGQPEVYGSVAAGLVLGGLAAGDSRVARAGGRVALALALSGSAVTAGKVILGRPRPSQSLDADGFHPFSGQQAMPSGHTAMAFALATSLSDEIHRTWATVGLYTLAGATGWSRINDNQHWLSDVAAGALVGITSAKLASGRWRLFQLHPPSVLLTPHTMGVGWHASF
jgi:membrane-associated phospholipid phosphatase